MRAGRIMMLAAYSPMTPAGVSDPARKVMVFGRCDILHFGPHPRPLQPEVPEATEDSDPFAAGGVDPFAQDDRDCRLADVRSRFRRLRPVNFHAFSDVLQRVHGRMTGSNR